VRELLWIPVARSLPPETRRLYIAPDGDIARLPWPALPGEAPGSVLLERYAFAVVPHGPYLLEKLRYPSQSTKSGFLALGSVDYGRGEAGFVPLPGTVRELKAIVPLFAGQATVLTETDATPRRLRELLPEARIAHLATHGFFAARELAAERKRSQDQWDAWHYSPERSTIPAGTAQENPLAFVGLALAGANDPRADALLTGLNVLDLVLDELQLAVLSACESGLGEMAGGEGVLGLQRAFHMAGCPNVIASLWQVSDAATAALMAQFYHELWVNKKAPLEALREAQLTIYRHPERIAALAGERGRPALAAAAKLGSAAMTKPNEKPKTTPTRLWAAFVLSGVGR
jgi:CHAT domain-containing protein